MADVTVVALAVELAVMWVVAMAVSLAVGMVDVMAAKWVDEKAVL